MLSLEQRFAIQVLLRAGHTKKEVARLVGASLRTVQRVASGEPVTDLRASRRARVGRPSMPEEFRELVKRIVEETPDVPSSAILERARQHGYSGGRSALYSLIAALRGQAVVETTPGAVSEHDFGGCDLFFSRAKRRIHFFVSMLKYPPRIYVSLVRKPNIEYLIRAMVRHFESLGGLPLQAIFLNPEVGAWLEDSQFASWQYALGYLSIQLGIALLINPRQAPYRTKRLAPSIVKRFFKRTRFDDYRDIQAKLLSWNEVVNRRTDSGSSSSRLGQLLRPLTVPSEELALHFPVRVGSDATVVFQEESYGMPPETAGMDARLLLYEDRVEIVAGGRRVSHLRSRSAQPLPRPGEGSGLGERQRFRKDEKRRE